ncbi:hypothetical protein ONS95_001610 [Cadophora gregata]|uniref:uncharacterized protein n=1 Tax=Cadophora gregata TaxID=51156 RepID=UPI0026DD0B8B|nr:uncharacterized protein ONS95_001610 [Cadophora gregata]KAK0111236.1 hypothetical protein ONS95_001610 [Cadophora gregata]
MVGDMNDFRGRLRQAQMSKDSTTTASNINLRGPEAVEPHAPRRSRHKPDPGSDSFQDVEIPVSRRRPRTRRGHAPSIDSREGSSVGSPGPRAGRFMPSRPMFDWLGPLCQLLKISEDSSIDDISDALEDAASKLELAESIRETMMSAKKFNNYLLGLHKMTFDQRKNRQGER